MIASRMRLATACPNHGVSKLCRKLVESLAYFSTKFPTKFPTKGLLGQSLAVVLLLSGCASPKQTYPAHWWAPVSKEGAPAWEILPQEAGPGEVILSKRNELGLLSNFAATPFTFKGKRYASLEGFWQMMKYPESDEDPRAKFPGFTWAYSRD